MISPSVFSAPRPLADVIRQRRRALGLTQHELAARLGAATCVHDVRRLEAGQILLPAWNRLHELARALELPLTALTGFVDAENKPLR
ncbi:MAG TPA: helix-turn-helix domain-containing protein [Thermomicrobiales bacterium]|nr:helix-turn-helix domain-containing protein [Thermomicrobiales bacterium]